MKKIIIVGGGLGGLITAINLAKNNIASTVIEKKTYPFHRVCGEYISNETVPFLKKLSVYPELFNPPQIDSLLLSSVSGQYEVLPLDLGGFGISRYSFDNFLHEEAKKLGVEFLLNTEIDTINYQNNSFSLCTPAKDALKADIVIGAFGKRSKVDQALQRSFFSKRSPYVGVKYHARTNHPANVIALHNFDGGYCGVSNIEEGKTTVCYLIHRDKIKLHKNIQTVEEEILYKNPLLQNVFKNSTFIYDKPEIISEISFETKEPVENHIFMVGDAAGMITPLCGNGMAMAIHSAKILSELIIESLTNATFDRNTLEQKYIHQWNTTFKNRLWAGRKIQNLFGSEFASSVAINLALKVKPLARAIIKRTHGQPF